MLTSKDYRLIVDILIEKKESVHQERINTINLIGKYVEDYEDLEKIHSLFCALSEEIDKLIYQIEVYYLDQ